MSPNFYIFSYLEKHWHHYWCHLLWLLKKNFTIKSQNRVLSYGSDILRNNQVLLWVSFQIRHFIAKHLSFLSHVRLRCHHSQNNVCWKLVTSTLLFIKLGNWPTGYKSPWSARSRLDFRSILLKERDLLCLLKLQLSLLQLLLTGYVTTKWQTKRLRFNHTRLRSKTWNSKILPIQCLFSKLRRSYAPFWQKSYHSHSCPVP